MVETKFVNKVDDAKAKVNVNTLEVELRVPLQATNIKSSPYNDPANYLDLTTLSKPARLFALALTHFDAVRPDYATSSYMVTFNFDVVFEVLRDMCADVGIQWQRQEFYVVIFRSKLRDEADRARLGHLDQESHREVCINFALAVNSD